MDHVSHVFTGAGNTLPVLTAREQRPCSRVVKTSLVHLWARSVYTGRVHGPWSITLTPAESIWPTIDRKRFTCKRQTATHPQSANLAWKCLCTPQIGSFGGGFDSV